MDVSQIPPDQVIRNHLTGMHTIGVYPLLSDDTCHFLAVDFDKAEWQENARAFMKSCRELDIPAQRRLREPDGTAAD